MNQDVRAWRKTSLRVEWEAINRMFEAGAGKFFPTVKSRRGNTLEAHFAIGMGDDVVKFTWHSSTKVSKKSEQWVRRTNCDSGWACHPPTRFCVPWEFCCWADSLLNVIGNRRPHYFGFWLDVATFFHAWCAANVHQPRAWNFDDEEDRRVSLSDEEEYVIFPEVPANAVCFFLCTEPWGFYKASRTAGVLNGNFGDPERPAVASVFHRVVWLFSYLDVCQCCTELCDILCVFIIVHTRHVYGKEGNTSPMSLIRGKSKNVMRWAFN